jgi:hypothetical protein
VNLTSPLPIGKEIRHCKGGGLGETIVEGRGSEELPFFTCARRNRDKKKKGN